MVTGLGSIAWTLRGLEPVTPRGLLAGVEEARLGRRPLVIGTIAADPARLLLLAAALARNWTKPPDSSAPARCC